MAGLGKVNWEIGEYGKEPTGFSVNIPELTATNIAAKTTQIQALNSALALIIVGTRQTYKVTSSIVDMSNAYPSDKNAQRERKWTVTYQDVLPFFDAPDNTIPNPGFHKLFTVDIPTADLSLLVTRSDTVDVADFGTELAGFATAFEAVVRSPYNGSVQVLSFTASGRNL